MKISATKLDHGAQRAMDAHLLDAGGLCRPIPAAELLSFPPDQVAAWANRHNVFQYPTVELIQWLREAVPDLSTAIEICAGMGVIGRELGIPQTDSGLHDVTTTVPEIARRYQLVGQRLMRLPKEVVKLEALDAVRRYRPRTVIGCWVTSLGRRGPTSDFGVDERKLLKKVRMYILVGNLATHGAKKILNKPHTVVQAPWLVSRSVYPEQNRIWIWPKR